MNIAVYAIRNPRGKIYVGQTANLQERLARHNGLLPTKNSLFTHKQGGPCSVFHKEMFTTRKDALVREKELKSAKGRKFLYNILITRP